MTEHSLWRVSRAFHRALSERQTAAFFCQEMGRRAANTEPMNENASSPR